MKRLLLLLTIFVLALAPMLAQTVTITLAGTLGPVENGGPDPLSLNGFGLDATITISTSATPLSSTATSVTYRLPAGSVAVPGLGFSNTKPWKMKITLAATHDTLVLSGPGPTLGAPTTVTATSYMKKNSFTTAVLKHPTSFTPSPQNLKPPRSTLKYTFDGSVTILGFTGTISD
jgi:hypothetical protein